MSLDHGKVDDLYILRESYRIVLGKLVNPPLNGCNKPVEYVKWPRSDVK